MTRRGRTIAAVAAALAMSLLATVPAAQAAPPRPADDPSRAYPVRPSVTGAALDRPPVYANGCHAPRVQTSVRTCTYGSPSAARVVVVFGDSHVTQWWAALDSAGRADGLRVIWMTKSACPAADVTVTTWRSSARYTQCDTWRREAIRRIQGYSRVDLVVLGSANSHGLYSRRTGARLTSPTVKLAEWAAGTRRTVSALSGHVRAGMIIRDTPNMGFDVPSCLRARNYWTRNCSRARSSAVLYGYWAHERSAAAATTWLTPVDLTDWICRPTVCGPVAAPNVLRYRDDNHLTTTFVRTLAPVVRDRMRTAMT